MQEYKASANQSIDRSTTYGTLGVYRRVGIDYVIVYLARANIVCCQYDDWRIGVYFYGFGYL